MRQVLSVSIDQELKSKVEKLSKKYKVSKSDIVKSALNTYLIQEEFQALRNKFIPKAQKAGFFTDEDVFDKIS